MDRKCLVIVEGTADDKTVTVMVTVSLPARRLDRRNNISREILAIMARVFCLIYFPMKK